MPIKKEIPTHDPYTGELNPYYEELTNKYKGKVRVLKAPCMGKCDYAPALEVEHNHVDNATLDKVDQVITNKSFHPVISKFIDLDNYIKNGELKSEGNSITEGIGSSRITKNFEKAIIDNAFSIDDNESLRILYDLIKNEGLSLGTSCGINIAGAIKLGKELGPGKTIVTILCDKSDKYSSKMFNKDFLSSKNLPIPDWI